MFHPVPGPTVDGILRFLLWAEMVLTASSAVRDEQAGALMAAVGDGRCAAAGPVDTGLLKARQSLRLPGSGRPIATTRRLLASMTPAGSWSSDSSLLEAATLRAPVGTRVPSTM
ncbi:hypothetical protein ADK35_11930 [Streptomyces viridochromogenes]|nr:hypothetical protein ADK36_36250 [Streptomyces viridochromogenes]KOG24083.1 hypothetical protein ADK35_11930 [Streptomyces viridochromogenes]